MTSVTVTASCSYFEDFCLNNLDIVFLTAIARQIMNLIFGNDCSADRTEIEHFFLSVGFVLNVIILNIGIIIGIEIVIFDFFLEFACLNQSTTFNFADQCNSSAIITNSRFKYGRFLSVLPIGSLAVQEQTLVAVQCNITTLKAADKEVISRINQGFFVLLCASAKRNKRNCYIHANR